VSAIDWRLSRTAVSAYKKKKAGRYLHGVAADHRALIETFQPYHLEDDAASRYLAVLRDLSNIDKHRLVHPVVIVGEGNAREVRFTGLEVTTKALFRLEHYITDSLFKRFESLFPLPAHAVDGDCTAPGPARGGDGEAGLRRGRAVATPSASPS
jgi:hypothetical protein